MHRRSLRRFTLATTTLATLLGAGSAAASSAIEYPDNGVAQFSRGGAWLATASDPIATYYNPAALATQTTGFQLGLNLPMQEICYERRGPGDTPVGPNSQRDDVYDEICNTNSGKVNAIPSLAFAWRVSERLGLGVSITPPSSFGKTEYPSTAPNAEGSRDIPAPQRYQSLGVQATLLWASLGAGYEVADGFRLGGAFVSGIAIAEFKAHSMMTVQTDQTQDESNNGDSLSTVTVTDAFIPGFVVSAHYSATDNLDFGAWYRWSDKVKADGDLDVRAPFFNTGGTGYQTNPNCSQEQEDQLDATGIVDNCAYLTETDAKVELTIPMELRVGMRFHVPAGPASALEQEGYRQDEYAVRDPLRDDLFDVELDFTWANNSAADETVVRFPAGVNVRGAPGVVPENADRPTGYKDSFGVRLGGQYNVVRNLFGLRAGTWYETEAQDAEYLSVTGVAAQRGGFSLGGVFRIGSTVDVEAGYMRVWSSGLDNEGEGEGLAIAGSGNPEDFRSYHAINGGKISQSANVFAVGGVARF